MQKSPIKQYPKSSIVKIFILFLCSYATFLILWIQVKDYYGYGMTFVVSSVIAGLKNSKFEKLTEAKDIVVPMFSHSDPRQKRDVLIDVPVKTSSYTFNVPLTFSILVALYPFIQRKKRAYLEAGLFLISVHFVYVYSREAYQLTSQLSQMGLETLSRPKRLMYEFVWSFTANMVVRFEPFLIGCYTFLRFKK
jgi:hypothetical protein